MGRKQEPDDLKPRLGSQRCEHIRVSGSVCGFHISKILEIPVPRQELFFGPSSSGAVAVCPLGCDKKYGLSE